MISISIVSLLSGFSLKYFPCYVFYIGFSGSLLSMAFILFKWYPNFDTVSSWQAGYLDIWEPATLSIKREGYSIKCSRNSGVVVTEKFSATTSVCFLTCLILMIIFVEFGYHKLWIELLGWVDLENLLFEKFIH